MKLVGKEKLRSSLRIKLLILFVTVLLIVFMFPYGESIESGVPVGSIWIHEDLIASQTFEILKDPKQLGQEIQQAAKAIQPIFLRDISLENIYLDSLKKTNLSLNKALINNSSARNNSTFLSNNSFSTFYKFIAQTSIICGSKIKTMSAVFDVCTLILIKIFQKGLLDLNYKEIPKDSIALREGKFENEYPKKNYLDRNSANNFIELYLNENVGTNTELNEAIEEYISNFIKPNLIFSKNLTRISNSKCKR